MTRKEEIRKLAEAEASVVAQRIGACAWYDTAERFLTKEEKLEVRALWDSMPSNTCWMDAFFEWIKE